ncbi:MAG: hypothetical protein AAF310_01500, partial [Myxococcota bacterium]
ERKPATKGGDQMIKHNQTLRVCYTALALALCTLSIGCSDDDSEDNLAATMASLIASGNCVDQEPVTLSAENQIASVGNYTLAANDLTAPITFIPSVCMLPNNQIKHSGKAFAASDLIYLKQINLGSLNRVVADLSLNNANPNTSGILKYLIEQQSVIEEKSVSNKQGSFVATATLEQGGLLFVAADLSIAQSNVGNLFSLDSNSVKGYIITEGCNILIEATSITLEEGDDIILPVNLDIFGIGGKGPDSTCSLLKKAKLDKKCSKISNTFGKKACNAIFSKFTQTLVCLSVDKALESIAGFVPISTESCSEGNLLSQCLRESGAQMCTILTPLLSLAAG